MATKRPPIFRKGAVSTRDAQMVLRRLEQRKDVLPQPFMMNKETRGRVESKIWHNTAGIIPQVRVKQRGTGIAIRRTPVLFFNTNLQERGYCVYGETAYFAGAPLQARLVLALFDPTTYIEVVGPSGRKDQWENKWTGEVHNEGQWAGYQNSDNLYIYDFGLTWPITQEFATLLVIDGEEFKIKPDTTTIFNPEIGTNESVPTILGESGTMYMVRMRSAIIETNAGRDWSPVSPAALYAGSLIEIEDGFKFLPNDFGSNEFGAMYNTGVTPLRSTVITLYDYSYGLSNPYALTFTQVYYGVTADGKYWRGQFKPGTGYWDVDCDGRFMEQVNVVGVPQYPLMGRVSALEWALYKTEYSHVILWHNNPEPCTLFLPHVPAWEL